MAQDTSSQQPTQDEKDTQTIATWGKNVDGIEAQLQESIKQASEKYAAEREANAKSAREALDRNDGQTKAAFAKQRADNNKAFAKVTEAQGTARTAEQESLKTITTDEVQSAINRELAALLPQLKSAGWGKKFANGDNMTVDNLREAFQKLKIINPDSNRDGNIDLREVTKQLQNLPDVPQPRAPRGRT